jgi:hypothetical protein
MNANRGIVVSSPTVCPVIWSRWLRV